jgi:hypothetical protein
MPVAEFEAAMTVLTKSYAQVEVERDDLAKRLEEAENLLFGTKGCTGMMKLMANRLGVETIAIVKEWLDDLAAYRADRAGEGKP